VDDNKPRDDLESLNDARARSPLFTAIKHQIYHEVIFLFCFFFSRFRPLVKEKTKRTTVA
jgi:hypothetical protein